MDKLNQISLSTQRTGRIAMLGEAHSSVTDVWMVLHGYRQLATNFAKKFAPLHHANSWILAPEGLSRFYVEGFTGRVGASWMTREQRLDEIADQLVWLDRVWEYIHAQELAEHCRIHLLGFSQGVATLWRWLATKEEMPHSVVFYAGKIPEEFDEKFDAKLATTQLFFAYGTEDQFLTPERLAHEKGLIDEHMPNSQVISFIGKHDIYPEALTKIQNFLYP